MKSWTECDFADLYFYNFLIFLFRYLSLLWFAWTIWSRTEGLTERLEKPQAAEAALPKQYKKNVDTYPIEPVVKQYLNEACNTETRDEW